MKLADMKYRCVFCNQGTNYRQSIDMPLCIDCYAKIPKRPIVNNNYPAYQIPVNPSPSVYWGTPGQVMC